MRVYLPGTRELLPFVANAEQYIGLDYGGNADIAVCHRPIEGDDAGDHLLLLSNDLLLLFNESGALLGKKVLFKTGQSGANQYYPFGLQSHAIAVGDLVDNPGGTYEEEVVVATVSGALMWMHVDDLLASSSDLPSSYDVEVAKGNSNPNADTQQQPRTNESLAAAWAITQRSGDSLLHVLDQRGAYWQVDHSGTVKLWERDYLATEARTWEDLGNRDSAGNPITLTKATSFPDPSPVLDIIQTGTTISLADVIVTHPWCPTHVLTAYLDANYPYYEPNNWHRYPIFSTAFEGFIAHRWTGAVVDPDPTGGQGKVTWFWSARSRVSGEVDSWSNLLEGLHIDDAGWQIDGLWASTGDSNVSGSDDRLGYLDLRSFVSYVPIMTQQAMRAVPLPGGGVALVLGCPGGHLRVVQPGTFRTSNATMHGTGTKTSAGGDYGYGMSGLDAKLLSTGDVRIWFGVVYGPTPEPAQYTSSTGVLQDNEVATGVLHTCTWNPSSGFSAVASVPLAPSTNDPRGGHGVIGICAGDLLPDSGAPADEVVVTTLAGDVIVFSADLQTQIWRTHVPGAAGDHNGIRIADLNGDGHKELYVTGSFGLWRFVQPEETDVILP